MTADTTPGPPTDDIRARHVLRDTTGRGVCRSCFEPWPCDTEVMARERDEMSKWADDQIAMQHTLEARHNARLDERDAARADTARETQRADEMLAERDSWQAIAESNNVQANKYRADAKAWRDAFGTLPLFTDKWSPDWPAGKTVDDYRFRVFAAHKEATK